MMRGIGRSILAVLGGAVVCGIVIFAVEAVSSRIYPLPPGFDPTDLEALKAAIATLPPGAFAFVLFGWFLGPLAGSWVAARLAPDSPVLHGMIVTALVAAVTILNLIRLPHPAWMWAAGPLVVLGGGWLGARFAARGRPVPTD
jgi:hypothetical protein